MSAAVIEPWYETTNRSWGAVLAAAVERNPGGELIVHHEIRVTFEAFYTRVQELAHGLLLLGVARGDRVAIWMGNRPEWMVAQFGTYELGAALVPIHTRFSSDEIAFALARAQVSTFIVEARILDGKIDGLAVLERLMPELFGSTPATFTTPRFPHLRRVVVFGAGDAKPTGAYGFDEVSGFGRDWRSADALSRARLAVNPFDVANIVFTSGTTGFPKGGMSMHRNNMAALHHWIDRTDLRPEDRMYLGVPFATNFGCAYVSQLSVLAGNTVIIDDIFAPDTALRAIARERVTWLPGAPTMYIMLLAHPRLADFDLRALRAAIVGGAPCPPDVVRALKVEMGFEYVIQCYGLSECGGLSSSTFMDDPLEKTAATVGKAFPSCVVRVTDPRSGTSCADGEQGEIWLRDVLPGSAVGKGYYDDAEQTRATITDDGWFRTGDLGVMDADGYLSITGRLKDMFVVGGYNAYPAEIEAVLHRHRGIRLAQVVGVPDPRLGEVGCLYVERRDGSGLQEDEIIAYCRQRMANYKVPRYVRFVAADEFPLTPSGKVKKFELRRRAIAELGLEH